ncbi:hypothetical protein L2E82_34904 [Cichorium intybus]|uniref:Uncharacterized protein n=1 Tax=Cichorium intybus TaxID=13427 RepID=A0ACB9BMZ5_CICIN|nr:hypothetical protein L2E82_34904 [Cichorium intybus]
MAIQAGMGFSRIIILVGAASQRIELIRATLAALHAFLSWIPLGYIFESPLLETLLKFFPMPSYHNLTLQCLTEVTLALRGVDMSFLIKNVTNSYLSSFHWHSCRLFFQLLQIYHMQMALPRSSVMNAVKSSGNAAFSAKRQALLKGKNASPMWDRLVFNKIKEKLGGRVRFMVSGDSLLSPDFMDFLKGLQMGITLPQFLLSIDGRRKCKNCNLYAVKKDPLRIQIKPKKRQRFPV